MRSVRCIKLAGSGFLGQNAVLIYGFDDPRRPLVWLIDAFELIARQYIGLGLRISAPIDQLVHPVFASGAVFPWEIISA